MLISGIYLFFAEWLCCCQTTRASCRPLQSHVSVCLCVSHSWFSCSYCAVSTSSVDDCEREKKLTEYNIFVVGVCLHDVLFVF